jgi:hypothetical protein
MPGLEHPDRLESSVERLAQRVRELEGRVSALEASSKATRDVAAEARAPESEALVAPEIPQGTLALLGRTLLVLAGAYLIRALTEGRVLPAGVGIAVGLAYAAFWQLRSDRDGLSGMRASACFHGLTSSLIAFPLIWEGAARFSVISTRTGYALLVCFFALGLGVAWHRRLTASAWLTTSLALGAALALLVSSHDLLAALLAIVAVAGLLEWLAFRDTWLGLRWVAAGTLDAVAVLLIAVATRPEIPESYASLSLGAAPVALLTLPGLYVAAVAARTLRRGQLVTGFEVAQGAAAVVLGLGGAWRILAVHGAPARAPGALALVLGALCYAAAFAYAERRAGQGRNFYFYSTAALLLSLGGTVLFMEGLVLPLTWGGLGLLASLLGRRFNRMTLRVHSALYLVATAFLTGLLVACAHALAGQAVGPLPPTAWVAAAAAAAGWSVLATDPGAPRSGWSRTPQLLLALLVVFAVGKALQMAAWAAVGGLLAEDPGAAAVVRTAVLVALALTLAWLSRGAALPELRWLVYPLLILGGVKLLAQDLRHGRPATLVASLSLYGAILIVVPRLLKPPTTPR